MSRVNQSVVQNVDIQPKKQKSFHVKLVAYLLLFLGDSLAPSPSLSLAKAYGKQSTAGYDSDEEYVIYMFLCYGTDLTITLPVYRQL